MNNASIIARLDSLFHKVEKLMAENKLLKHENVELKKDNEQLKRINNIQKNSLDVLEEKEKMTNIAQVVSNLPDDEKKALKKAINQQIKEIDQCLKLLNI